LIENSGRQGAQPSAMSSSVAGGAAGSSGVSRVGGPCGACKFLSRRCISDCIFAPYFDQDQGAVDFAAVHKVFGASNVSNMLNNIPMEKRADAVTTFCYEVHTRLLDPVYGCFSNIFSLHQ
jgi:LOB domain-containing protein 18